jgi:alpha-tubulin suppressor-like RCC1 family protein
MAPHRPDTSALYTAPLAIATPVTVKAVAFKTGWEPSAVRSVTFNFNYGTLSTPTSSLSPGTHVGAQTVTLAGAEGTELRYTTTGVEPTVASPLYATALLLQTSGTLKVKAFKPGYTASATLTVVYAIKVPAPTLSQPAGTYAPGTTTTVTTGGAASTLRMTLSGGDPTATDAVVLSGATLTLGQYTLKVRAYQTGCEPSDVTAATYALTSDLTQPKLAAGQDHSVLVLPDGTLQVWGRNASGQLALGTTGSPSVPVVAPLTGIIAAAAGSSHTLLLTHDATVLAAGLNSSGQVGDGSTTQRTSAVLVAGLAQVTAVATGSTHSLALRSDGTLWAWGSNTSGQLGDGTTIQRTSPVQVSGLTDVVAIAAGGSHSLAVRADGTVWSWGLNSNRQLADPTVSSRSTPGQVGGITTATSVAAGASHSLALLADGTLVAWGANSSGQVGDGTVTQRSVPVGVLGVEGALTVHAGGSFSGALGAGGQVWTWGANGQGQLATGTTANQSTPAIVTGLASVARLGLGSEHGLALTTDRVVYTWGGNSYGELGEGTVTGRLTAANISDAAFAWRVATPVPGTAPNTFTMPPSLTLTSLTPGATIHYTTDGSEPTDASPAYGTPIVPDVSITLKARAFVAGMPASLPFAGAYVLRVATPTFSPAAGNFTAPTAVTMAVTTPGAVVRYTTDGSEPSDASAPYDVPLPIATSTALKAAAFKSGWSVSATRSGTYTMNFGTLSAPTASVPGGSYVGAQSVTLSAAAGATIRYTMTGSEPTTGSSVYVGALPIAVSTTLKAKAFHPDYTTSSTMTHVYSIAAAPPVLSLTSGTVEPGAMVTITHPDPAAIIRITLTGVDPAATDPAVPTGTTLLAGSYTLKARAFRTGATDSAVAAATYALTSSLGPGAIGGGANSSILATPDGLLYAWGENGLGQLGDGSTTDRSTPRLIQTLTGVTSLSIGTAHALARTHDGRVFAWGSNGSGRLGDGTTTTRTAPVWIASLSDVVQIAAGDSHSLVVLADGSVHAWGGSTYGQLGLGPTGLMSTPTLVPGLSNIVAVAAGINFSLALDSAGDVYAWGRNTDGQLGLGQGVSADVPTLVSSLADIAGIAAGGSHAFAWLENGAVLAWGSGLDGRLGLGSTTTSYVPTVVPGLNAADLRAGGMHTLAVRGDLAVLGWGGNPAGQVGDGTTSTRTSPTPIPSLSGVALLATGASHSLAVTPGGTVVAWGLNSNSQLGDATTTARPSPVTIASFPGAWGRTQPPQITPTSGTFGTPLTVSVLATTPVSMLRYTTTGEEPGETDEEVPASGEFPIDRTTHLRLRAWSPGRLPSRSVSAFYSLQPEAPTMTPGTGLYTSPQAVTLASATPSTTVRYTVDGSDPTDASPVYSSPISVATSTALKARAFRLEWTPSPVTSASFTFAYGTLAPPIITPSPGTYAPNQMVTLAAAPGATIRYTLNGGIPTEMSSAYTGPISIGLSGTQTIRARAYAVDYTTSALMTATFVVDATPPDGETLTGLTVSPSEVSVPVGGTRYLNATATYSGGSIRDATSAAIWTSLSPANMTVAANGLAHGVSVGTGSIQATLNSVSASALIEVGRSRFSRTGSILTPRTSNTATLLATGHVLITGGNRAGLGEEVDAAELYDPAAGTFNPGPGGIIGRTRPTATRLADGRVLIVGGTRWGSTPLVITAQVYDPTTGGVVQAGAGPHSARTRHTATLLADGRVLIAGGNAEYYGSSPLSSAEVYDPVSNTFAPTGAMTHARDDHSATLLPDGTVLIAGGGNADTTAERYDPETGTFTPTGSLSVGSAAHSATVLMDGRVLIVGGADSSQDLSRAEVYDPASGTFTVVGSLAHARAWHTATLLGDGRVLVAAGGSPVAELYDSSRRLFAPAGQMIAPRFLTTATLLPTGAVLFAGGPVSDSTTELYTPEGIELPPASLQITPAEILLRVGEVGSLSAVDHVGVLRSDAVWSVTDPSLATLTVEGGVATVRANAAGPVTIAATVSGVSAHAQVTIVEPSSTVLDGTTLWASAAEPDMELKQIVRAAVTPEGPHFFAVYGNPTHAAVRAMTLDGRQLWRVVGPPVNGNATPDAAGGILLTLYNTCDNINPMRIVNLDKHGNQAWAVTSASTCTAPTRRSSQSGKTARW